MEPPRLPLLGRQPRAARRLTAGACARPLPAPGEARCRATASHKPTNQIPEQQHMAEGREGSTHQRDWSARHRRQRRLHGRRHRRRRRRVATHLHRTQRVCRDHRDARRAQHGRRQSRAAGAGVGGRGAGACVAWLGRDGCREVDWIGRVAHRLAVHFNVQLSFVCGAGGWTGAGVSTREQTRASASHAGCMQRPPGSRRRRHPAHTW